MLHIMANWTPGPLFESLTVLCISPIVAKLAADPFFFV